MWSKFGSRFSLLSTDLVCLGCYNKAPQYGWFINNRLGMGLSFLTREPLTALPPAGSQKPGRCHSGPEGHFRQGGVTVHTRLQCALALSRMTPPGAADLVRVMNSLSRGSWGLPVRRGVILQDEIYTLNQQLLYSTVSPIVKYNGSRIKGWPHLSLLSVTLLGNFALHLNNSEP